MLNDGQPIGRLMGQLWSHVTAADASDGNLDDDSLSNGFWNFHFFANEDEGASFW